MIDNPAGSVKWAFEGRYVQAGHIPELIRVAGSVATAGLLLTLSSSAWRIARISSAQTKGDSTSSRSRIPYPPDNQRRHPIATLEYLPGEA